MAVSKAQYEAIEEIYRERRRSARLAAQERTEKIRRALPELGRLESDCLNASLEGFRISLNGGDASTLREKMSAIRRQKETLLAEAGFQTEDLMPQYHCPHCEDTGRREGRSCECFQQLLEQLGSSDPFAFPGASFEDFSLSWYDDKEMLKEFGGRTARQIMQNNLTRAEAFVEHFGEKKGNLFISGPVGTGKTLLSRAIATAVDRKGFSVYLLTAQEFFGAAEAAVFGREEEGGLSLEKIKGADLLIIDDLGSEFTSRKLAQNALFTTINERQLRELGTVISSNESLNEIEDHYLARVSSRLAGNYERLPFLGPDIRLASKRLV